MECLDEQLASALAEGSLEQGLTKEAERHIDDCDSCREVVAQVVKGSSARGRFARGSASKEANEKEAEESVLSQRGESIGRYLVLDVAGQGNVGVVYSAYDPKLDRKVALKLLKRNANSTDVSEERLVREAKAMARLSHPNVVTVHDVGRVGERTFVAMEFVEGLTLRAWLQDERHRWQDIVAQFGAAARGLAAAHASGIVHRDFKTENVFIGEDKRVRVGDFGMVRLQDDLAAPSTEEISESTSLAPLTETGSVLGTILYLAPECLQGETADALSDQYSFCVSLYEALYEQYPFRDASFPELKHDVLAGHLQTPPPKSAVPKKVRAALLRGMSVDRDQRYASMEALWQSLDGAADQHRRKQMWAISGAMVLLSIVVLYSLFNREEERSGMCQSADKELVGIWDPGVKARMKAAFDRSGSDLASRSFEAVTERFDDHAKGWKAMHVETCEATHIAGTQSSELLDVRMQCLRRHAWELRAHTQLFASRGHESEIVKAAVKSATKLSSIAECAEVSTLQTVLSLPSDPALRSRIEATEVRLSEALAVSRTGKVDEAHSLSTTLAKDTEDLDFAPVRGRVLYQLGMAEIDSGDYLVAEKTLEKALRSASRGKDDHLIAEIWLGLIQSVRMQERYEDALSMRVWAEIAVSRAGNDSYQRKRFVSGISQLAIRTGDNQLAAKLLEESLAETEARVGLDHVNIAFIGGNLGSAYLEMGQYSRARELFQRSLHILERKKPGHPSVAMTHGNLAAVYVDQEQFEQAEHHQEKALALFIESLGDQHPYVADTLLSYGELFSAQNEHEKAREYYFRALSLQTKLTGEASVGVGRILLSIANAANDEGDHKGAKVHFRNALMIFREKLGPANPLVGSTLRGLAYAHLGTKADRQALPLFEEVLKIHENKDTTPRRIADVKMGLARTLWNTKEDRPRALLLAREARDALLQSEVREEDLESVVDWLKERRSIVKDE